MPSPFDPNLEQEEQSQQSAQQPTQQQVPKTVTVGQSATIQTNQGTPSPGAGGITQRTQSSSGRFQNLKDYIRGNVKGTQKTAENISSDIKQQTDDVSGAIKSTVDTAKTNIQQQQQSSASAIGQAISNIQQGRKSSIDQMSTPVADEQIIQGTAPTPVTAETLEQSLETAKGAIGRIGELGKREMQEVQDVGSRLKDIEGLNTMSRTEGGIRELLRQQAGSPQYSRGANVLDTALIRSTAPAKELIKKAGFESTLVRPEYEKQVSAAESQLQSAISNLQTKAQELGGELSQADKDLLGQLQNRLQEVQSRSRIENLTNQQLIDAAKQAGLNIRARGNEFIVSDESNLRIGTLTRDQLNRMFDLQTNIAGANLGNIDPETAAKLNVLRRFQLGGYEGGEQITQGEQFNLKMGANLGAVGQNLQQDIKAMNEQMMNFVIPASETTGHVNQNLGDVRNAPPPPVDNTTLSKSGADLLESSTYFATHGAVHRKNLINDDIGTRYRAAKSILEYLPRTTVETIKNEAKRIYGVDLPDIDSIARFSASPNANRWDPKLKLSVNYIKNFLYDNFNSAVDNARQAQKFAARKMVTENLKNKYGLS